MARILVGMSGGVDSSIAALLLKKQGYDITGAYIKTWSNEYDVFGDCPSAEDIEYASATCKKLGIGFEVVNLIDTYHEKIVQYLVDGYRRGITPNPDIMCNREIKFGAFLDFALQNGFSEVATGHYCRLVEPNTGTRYIAEGLDKNKDQSYFLALTHPDQLKHARFPVGELEKSEVRALAREHDLPNANRKDSQGICFLGKVKINDFLKTYIPDRPGLIVNSSGKPLGEHKGLHRYTIGQRKGIGIPSNQDFKAYVVVAKDLETNQLIVAFDDSDTPGLYCKSVVVHSHSFCTRPFIEDPPRECRVRYRDPRIPIERVERLEGDSFRVVFETPQRALAQGQVLAFYEEERLLGGGVMIPEGSLVGSSYSI
ncbi:MAG: tRNA 2-thiouridine(34) synthase MnmA [Opitutales bacterium]|nr:tRNA 2-thiouridine(34) synthase MnmA [Opitutales bacterium]